MTLSLEAFDFLQRGNAASGAERFAIEAGGGAGEVQNALQLPALQNAVAETSVKEIAGASGVHDAHFVGRRIPETAAVPSESAVNAQSGANGVVAEFAFEEREGLEEIGFAGGGGREVAGADGIIHEFQDGGELGRPAVEVGDDGDFSGVGPSSGAASGGGVVAVDVEQTSGGDPIFLEEGRRNAETRVAMPGDGAFAGVLIHEDKGEVAGRVATDGKMKGNPFPAQGGAMQIRGGVIADAADVVRAKSPAAAGKQGGGDLSTEEDPGASDLGFMAGSGKVGEFVDVVRGVFADAEDVDSLRGTHETVVQGKRRSEKCKERRLVVSRG